jgi:hypothetical protein
MLMLYIHCGNGGEHVHKHAKATDVNKRPLSAIFLAMSACPWYVRQQQSLNTSHHPVCLQPLSTLL